MNVPQQFVAWDGNAYDAPPPAGWVQAQDGRWWPRESLPPQQPAAVQPLLQAQAPPMPGPRPNGHLSSEKPRRWFHKKRFIIPIGLAVGLSIAGALAGDPDTPSASPDNEEPLVTTTTAGATTATERVTTTTTEPVTTTAAVSTSFEVFTAEGTGDGVIDLVIPDDQAAIMEISYSGSGNFAIISYTGAGERIDLLVNEIGTYSGTQPLNFTAQAVAELEIKASGPWSMVVRPLLEAPLMLTEQSGSGDAVLLYGLPDSRLDITHTGDGNFAVLAWGPANRDLVVNEIGNYSGTVRIDSATAVMTITADGDWTLRPSS